MVVLIDTNVIIDFLITREPFYAAASQLIGKCANQEIKGYVALHSIPNIWYILRKVPEERRRTWLLDICHILQVAGADHEEVVSAIAKEEFADLEDCLQDQCAKSVGASYIITRNVQDFVHSEVPAISPEDFLAKEDP